MSHFTITLENRDKLRDALNDAAYVLMCPMDCESDWAKLGRQLGDYLESVEDFDGNGDQLMTNTAPVAKFAPMEFYPPHARSLLPAMESACKGLEQFIALCPYCGWGEFLNAVRATLDNARAAV